ncbi:MAG: hypothetical protein Udaeo2_18730 [Candidatus Udaeobacter sp.]|nr:MAG: hypothetical protein Udaeo2_18730 [Candidatus Udaeobacter sp.]
MRECRAALIESRTLLQFLFERWRRKPNCLSFDTRRSIRAERRHPGGQTSCSKQTFFKKTLPTQSFQRTGPHSFLGSSARKMRATGPMSPPEPWGILRNEGAQQSRSNTDQGITRRVELRRSGPDIDNCSSSRPLASAKLIMCRATMLSEFLATGRAVKCCVQFRNVAVCGGVPAWKCRKLNQRAGSSARMTHSLTINFQD